MSDIEYNDEEFDANIEDEVDETDLELIRIVRNNPGLWDKSSKTYSNSIKKDMIWNSVASALSIPTTGSATAKRFRTLRTTFSRHLKKVKQSQPRSGAGSDWSVYQPTWPLYNELLFLSDIIKPRQTKSNISTKLVNVLKPKADKNSNNSTTVLARNTYQPQQSQSSSSSSTCKTVKTPTNTTQLQGNIIFSDNDDSDLLFDNIAESDNESNEHAGKSLSTSGNIKKRPIIETPPPDKFYQKKKMKNDTSMENLDKLAGSLVTLSQQMISTPSSQTSRQQEKENFDPEVEGFLLLMKASLQRTRTQHRIPCLIEMLNILYNFENKC